MEVHNLPQDLLGNSSEHFNVMDYTTEQSCKNQKVSLQQHTFSFLQEGSKGVVFDNKALTIENTEFLLMQKGNCLMTETLANTNANYHSILFFFSDQILSEFIKKYKVEVVQDIVRTPFYSFEYDQFLKSFVFGLQEICKMGPSVQSKLLHVKFEELMLYLLEKNGVSILSSFITKESSRSQHLLEIVESNKLNKLTLSELAFLSHMSVSSFKRSFENHFKETPSKWFQNRRLEHAAYELKNTSKRASEIYESVGYESLSTFIQAFKLKYGKTPKQYQSN